MENAMQTLGLTGAGRGLVAGALCLVVAHLAPAHELGPPVSKALAWDCWVDTSAQSTKVRCIVDLSGTAAQEVEPVLEHMVLHQIHDMIHGPEDVDDLNRLLDRNWHVLREGDVWTIRIFSPPNEDSWRTGRPQRLVRSLLCPPRTPCRVHFKDHPPR
jgi:hypothetical protein